MNEQLIIHSVGFGRENSLKNSIYEFFQTICGGPRSVLEVFLRTHMGHRYMSLYWCVINALWLFWVPIVIVGYKAYMGSFSVWEIVLQHATWYIFLVAYLVFAWKRRQETKPKKGYFTTDYYSRSTGFIHPRFYEIKIKGQYANDREIETMLEPAFAFGVGIALIILQQIVGLLIAVCAIIYCMSKRAEYRKGDNRIQDIIDADIRKRSLYEQLVKLHNNQRETGFKYKGAMPGDQATREAIYERMTSLPS